jgi:acetylornithine deacetylase/succinyl-diaminopimelate desuccinylase-like protein
MGKFKLVSALAIASLAATAAVAQPVAAVSARDTRLAQIAEPVRAQSLKHYVERLVSFGTRHTLSSQTDPKRGIGAAVRWAEAEMKSFGLETLQTCDTVTGRRVPAQTRICNAVAIQRGAERPNDVVIITGHIDSRVSDVMDASSDAPGANDDGSGTAAVIEAARVLSRHNFPGTIVYAALSGEEQGLYGGRIMAEHARARGWNVIANLNNDIIGNSCGSDGHCDAGHVRVFSEGPRWQGREDLAADIRRFGGENDSPSRNLSRFLESLADRLGHIGVAVRPIWRNDRFGRGGDHTEFLNLGFPAVRLTEAVENYRYQHEDVRVEDGIEYGDTIDKMDFAYLEKVTRLNVAALAALASAPPPPEPTVEGVMSTDTTVKWNIVPSADHYLIRWRRTDSSNWEQQRAVRGRDCDMTIVADRPIELSSYSCILEGIRVDDWVFGVSSVSADGFESPVAAAVPGGAFVPYAPPAPTE